MLFLPTGEICIEFHRFLMAGRNRSKSQAWRRLHAEAVERLYQFLGSQGPIGTLTQSRADQLLTDFEECLQHGTLQPDGADPLNLHWKPLDWKRVYRLMLAIACFARFISDEASVVDLSPHGATRAATLRDWFAFIERRNRSFLAHLKEFKRDLARGPRSRVGEILARQARRRNTPIPFPKILESRFFTTGLWQRVRRDAKGGICPHVVRDTLYYLLLFFGGLRKSEPLHFFLQDVEPDTDASQGTTLRLYHPEDGAVPGEQSNRAEYLRERYGLSPRNRLAETDPLFAGWKSVALDEQDPGFGDRSRVYWRNAEMGQFFWDLHRIYIQQVRPSACRHPYYFVNLSGSGLGRPMTMGAVNDSLDRALSRMGLARRAAKGLSHHAMRHAYGHALTEIGVDPESFRRMIHHESILSQEPYRRPMPHLLSRMLQAAADRMEAGFEGIDTTMLGVRFRSDPLGIFNSIRPTAWAPPTGGPAKPVTSAASTR